MSGRLSHSFTLSETFHGYLSVATLTIIAAECTNQRKCICIPTNGCIVFISADYVQNINAISGSWTDIQVERHHRTPEEVAIM